MADNEIVKVIRAEDKYSAVIDNMTRSEQKLAASQEKARDANVMRARIEKQAYEDAKKTMDARLRQMRDHDQAMHKSSGLIDNMATSMKGFIASAVGIGTITSAFRSLDEYATSLAKKVGEVEKSFISLAGIQKPNLGKDAAKLAQAGGAEFGVNAAESADMFQTVQSIYGGTDLQTAAQVVPFYQLMRFGVDKQSSQNLASLGKARGMTPEQITSFAKKVGDVSVWDVKALASSTESLQPYKDLAFGGGMYGAMSQEGFGKEILPTYVRGAGVALSDTQTKFGKNMIRVAKKYGGNWESMSQEQRLAFMTQASKSGVIDSSFEGLKKLGMEDFEKTTGLSAAIHSSDLARKTAAELRGIKGTELSADLTRLKNERPALASQMLQEKTVAEAAFADQNSTNAASAQNYASGMESAKKYLKENGHGLLSEGIGWELGGKPLAAIASSFRNKDGSQATGLGAAYDIGYVASGRNEYEPAPDITTYQKQIADEAVRQRKETEKQTALLQQMVPVRPQANRNAHQ